MTPVFLSDSFWLHFGTSSVSTGAATNADSTPTVTVAEDGTDMGYAPTVTNVATGLYKVQIDATAGNGFEAGKRYSVYVVATVGGISGRDGIGEFEVLAVDMNTALDAAISSRMATFTLPANFSALSITAGGLIDLTQAAADKVWATASRTLTAFGFAVGLTSAERDATADALLARTDGVETGWTPKQAFRIILSILSGKTSGYPAGPGVFTAPDGTTTRATVTNDTDGNRTSVTLSP